MIFSSPCEGIPAICVTDLGFITDVCICSLDSQISAVTYLSINMGNTISYSVDVYSYNYRENEGITEENKCRRKER